VHLSTLEFEPKSSYKRFWGNLKGYWGNQKGQKGFVFRFSFAFPFFSYPFRFYLVMKKVKNYIQTSALNFYLMTKLKNPLIFKTLLGKPKTIFFSSIFVKLAKHQKTPLKRPLVFGC